MKSSQELLAEFEKNGYFVSRKLVRPDEINQIKVYVEKALNPLQAPLEYETDVGYPGAPTQKTDKGGLTPRRLLHAYSRNECFRSWAKDRRIASVLEVLFKEKPLLSQSHHNCIMTKSPQYGSVTNWHQDIRYWSFDRPELISVWLALGVENEDNGCLRCIPGTHQLDLDRGRLDQYLFLRPELPENKKLIEQAKVIELKPGDVLFFHSRLFHAAGQNQTDQVKFSLVFTYHEANNFAIPGTKSANYPSIELS